MRIGVLAVQGDFEAHAKALLKLGVDVSFVNHPSQLSRIEGLIIPGGESTTMLKFLQQDNFLSALKEFAADRYLFGTCAGAILLAQEVTGPEQPALGLINVSIARNAYGRQLASHIGQGLIDNKPAEMVFIRAPMITRVDPNVRVFATYQGQPVGVNNDHCMITTFHPELTQETAIHQMFIEQVQKLKTPA